MKITYSLFATTNGQMRFPRSKRKRIRKKWAKDQRNFGPIPCVYFLYGNNLYLHGDDVLVVHSSLKELFERHVPDAQGVIDSILSSREQQAVAVEQSPSPGWMTQPGFHSFFRHDPFALSRGVV